MATAICRPSRQAVKQRSLTNRPSAVRSGRGVNPRDGPCACRPLERRDLGWRLGQLVCDGIPQGIAAKLPAVAQSLPFDRCAPAGVQHFRRAQVLGHAGRGVPDAPPRGVGDRRRPRAHTAGAGRCTGRRPSPQAQPDRQRVRTFPGSRCSRHADRRAGGRGPGTRPEGVRPAAARR